MANDASFDIVSNVDLQELNNAINQANKEITQRYDFKNSNSQISVNDDEIKLVADNDYKLTAIIDIIQTKLIKREVPIKNLEYGKIEQASGGQVRQVIKIKQGIETETAKRITKSIKETKLKVQAQIDGNKIRVSGKNRDDLQKIIQLIREEDFGIETQFINFR
ncbi:MAG: YajQ family cyclic di-GMP-binding protein [Vulcanibacillus sp.]